MLTTRQHQKEARSDAQRTDPTPAKYSPTWGPLVAGNGNSEDTTAPLIHRLNGAVAEMRIEIRYLRRDLEEKDQVAQRRADALERRVEEAVRLVAQLEERVEPMATTYEERKRDRQQFSGTVLAGSSVALVSIILTLLAPLILRLIQGG